LSQRGVAQRNFVGDRNGRVLQALDHLFGRRLLVLDVGRRATRLPHVRLDRQAIQEHDAVTHV